MRFSDYLRLFRLALRETSAAMCRRARGLPIPGCSSLSKISLRLAVLCGAALIFRYAVHSGDKRAGDDVTFTRLFDDSVQGGPDVSLELLEESKGVACC